MMLQFFLPPILSPFLAKEVQGDNPYKLEHLDDDDFSLPSLDGLSTGSNLSEYTCGDISHVDLCQILGPKVVEDEAKLSLPSNLIKPSNLEHSLSLDINVGYLRLRRAFLSDENDFWDKNVLNKTLQYKNVVSHGWDRHQEIIGSPHLPDHVSGKELIGSTRKTEYLMPKTAFVKANKAFETTVITEYNDHCFAIEMHTKNPDVPFGTKFVAHTKIVVYNTGNNTCRMECSVETEFPHGPPMGIARQIKAAMKSGSFEVFEKIGSAIVEYSQTEA